MCLSIPVEPKLFPFSGQGRLHVYWFGVAASQLQLCLMLNRILTALLGNSGRQRDTQSPATAEPARPVPSNLVPYNPVAVTPVNAFNAPRDFVQQFPAGPSSNTITTNDPSYQLGAPAQISTFADALAPAPYARSKFVPLPPAGEVEYSRAQLFALRQSSHVGKVRQEKLPLQLQQRAGSGKTSAPA